MQRNTAFAEPAKKIDASAEDRYWRQNFSSRDYVERGKPYSEYEPAYRYAWESRDRFPGKSWAEVENDLARGWDRFKGNSKMVWNDAKRATRDAWHRLEEQMPGDFDRDGR